MRQCLCCFLIYLGQSSVVPQAINTLSAQGTEYLAVKILLLTVIHKEVIARLDYESS